jgi:hypothetical protein
MRDYLNNKERLSLLFFKKYVDNTENMIRDWSKINNLTKEEHKYLKMALSIGIKAFDSILNRQSSDTLKSFKNSMVSSTINLDDNFAIKLYKKKLNTDLAASYEQNKDYYNLVEIILDQNCKNCTKDHKLCDFCKEFEEHCIPESAEVGMGTLPNCKYSYIK